MNIYSRVHMKKKTLKAKMQSPPSDATIAELADHFHLLGDTSRLRIVLACLEVPIAVGEIADQLELSGSLVSHHLRLLRAARIVKSERAGKQIFYSAADHHISELLANMLEHMAEPHADTSL
jgi:DNA-binding transcriptional ArsR family regulator